MGSCLVWMFGRLAPEPNQKRTFLNSSANDGAVKQDAELDSGLLRLGVPVWLRWFFISESSAPLAEVMLSNIPVTPTVTVGE